METFHCEYDGGTVPPPSGARPVVVGVVASSNLEVLVEPADLGGKCIFQVSTTVAGFDDDWRAVFADFIARHKPRDVRFSINDFAATPPVVSLRIDQAWETILEQSKAASR